MRALSLRALARMYLPEQRLFCFRMRSQPVGRDEDRVSAGPEAPRGLKPAARGELEGISRRYTAIVLIGLAAQDNDVSTEVLGGDNAASVCGRLLGDVDRVENLGDVALTLWAAIAWKHDQADRALDRLSALDPIAKPHPTVELAWALTALSIDPDYLTDRELAERIADRLTDSFNRQAGLFPHWPVGAAPSAWRAHVTCFADWVYPVQALSHYHVATGSVEAIEAAKHSAACMCRLQGPGGQWWWHYDVRNGRVIEPYPVYSVHQDSMAPMALFALKDACGQDHTAAIHRGLEWLLKSPERGDSLIDRDADLIWRKVARNEPGKLSRGLAAVASRVCSSWRLPGVDTLFRPNRIDYECRPYHLGWLLYAFPDSPTRSQQQSG